jgi:osmotically inducible protein OsmC
MSTSRASATWEGKLHTGKGHFAAESGVFQGHFTFPTRFEGAKGTNPEELIGAAHASCFSMALAHMLAEAGTPATKISTVAHVTVKDLAISRIRLETKGVVPGIDQQRFDAAAQATGKGCIVSRALAGVPSIEVEARLE